MAINAAAAGWRPLARRLTAFGSLRRPDRAGARVCSTRSADRRRVDRRRRMFLHYFRTTNDGSRPDGQRLGADRLRRQASTSASPPTRHRSARAEAGLRSPARASPMRSVERAWGGPIDVSADHLPLLRHRPGSAIHYGAGYSGNGVGPSWLGGRSSRGSPWASRTSRRPCRFVNRSVRPYRRSRSKVSAADSCGAQPFGSRRPEQARPPPCAATAGDRRAPPRRGLCAWAPGSVQKAVSWCQTRGHVRG